LTRAPRRIPPRPTPLFAVAVALSLLFGNVSQAVHLATVRHTVCPAHGEVLDVAAAALQPGPVGPGYPSSGPTLEDRSSHATAGHDTCPFQPYGRAPRWDSACRLQLAGRIPDSVAPLPCTGRTSPPSVPRFLLAPKHSPPA
jgi:hypothetical protein